MRARYLLIGVAVLFAVSVLTASSYAKIDPKTCVGMWLFDEGKGDTAADSSGNKNDGTLKNNPKWVDGKLDKALSFDVSNCVEKVLERSSRVDVAIDTGKVIPSFCTMRERFLCCQNLKKANNDKASEVSNGIEG